MNLVFFDLETAGLENKAEIIQIAAEVYSLPDFSLRASFEHKLKFDVASASPEALRVNSYSADAWENAVSPHFGFSAFANFCRTWADSLRTSKGGKSYYVCQLAGHNAASFDGPRIFDWCKRHGIFLPADMRVLDTMQLAQWHCLKSGSSPNSFKLGDLLDHFQIPKPTDLHDALVDVRACAALAKKLLGD